MDASQVENVRPIIEAAIRFGFMADHMLGIVNPRADGLPLPSNESIAAGFLNIILIQAMTILMNLPREPREENRTEPTNVRSNETEIANSMPNKANPYTKVSYGQYSWVQTESDIDVHIKIDETLTSSQLLVEVTATTIVVKSRLTDKIYLEGSLCKKCKATETLWVMDGSEVHIYLTKGAEGWWDCLIQSEPKLELNN